MTASGIAGVRRPMPAAPGDDPAMALALALSQVATMDGADTEGRDQIELLDALESACSAAKSRVCVEFAKDRVDEAVGRTGAGVPGAPAPDLGAVIARAQKSLTSELALAHRVSPSAMSRLLPRYRTACGHMPRLASAWSRGAVPGSVAAAITREAHHLTGEQLAELDRELAPRLNSLTPRSAVSAVRRFCTNVDPETAARRLAGNRRKANVTCRPVADGLVQIGITASTTDAVAMYAALRRLGKSTRDDDETLGMAMSRSAFERITGYECVEQVPIEIGLIMSDTTLFTGEGEPVTVSDQDQAAGEFQLPADFGAAIARGDGNAEAIRFVRRLYTDPIAGTLDTCDPTRRKFTAAQRAFITRRDQRCSTPWCDAPIRDIDHAQSHARGGATDTVDGNGRCQWCNLTKEEPGWSATATRASLGRPHAVYLTTPSGRTYRSQAPPVQGTPRPPRPGQLSGDSSVTIFSHPIETG